MIFTALPILRFGLATAKESSHKFSTRGDCVWPSPHAAPVAFPLVKNESMSARRAHGGLMLIFKNDVHAQPITVPT